MNRMTDAAPQSTPSIDAELVLLRQLTRSLVSGQRDHLFDGTQT